MSYRAYHDYDDRDVITCSDSARALEMLRSLT